MQIIKGVRISLKPFSFVFVEGNTFHFFYKDNHIIIHKDILKVELEDFVLNPINKENKIKYIVDLKVDTPHDLFENTFTPKIPNKKVIKTEYIKFFFVELKINDDFTFDDFYSDMRKLLYEIIKKEGKE